MNPEVIKSLETNSRFDFSKLSEKSVHAMLIREWLQCFQYNVPFGLYCYAKRKEESQACVGLEERFPRFKELYEDWGDIHALPSIMEEDRNDEFFEWYESKQHLFGWPEATIADPLDWIAEPENTTLVSIPNGYTREQLVRALTEFISQHPGVLGSGPKYQLNNIKGQRMSDTLKFVVRARTAYISETIMPKRMELISRP